MQGHKFSITNTFLQKIILVFAFACILGGCGVKHVSVGELAGTYRVRYNEFGGTGLGVETLILKADGTYVQIFKPTYGKGWKNTGRWLIESEPDGDKTLHLIDMLQALDVGYNKKLSHPMRGDGCFPILRSRQKYEFAIFDDCGYAYKRVK